MSQHELASTKLNENNMRHRIIFFKLKTSINLFFEFLDNTCVEMESADRCPDGSDIFSIIRLPEEIIREIFDYLSFETLYFAVRKVCKKIQTYVDRYIDFAGTSFLFLCKEGSEDKVIEMIQLPKKGSIVLRKPVLSFPCLFPRPSINAYRLNDEITLETPGDRRIQKMFYEAMGEIIICYIYKSQKGLFYRYDLESKNWERFLESCTTQECLDYDESSHKRTPKLVPPKLVSAFSTSLLFFRNNSLFLIPKSK